LEQNWEFPVGVRAIDIAAEYHAVAHFDRNAGFDPDWVLLARRALQTKKQTEKKKERQPTERHRAEHSEILPSSSLDLGSDDGNWPIRPRHILYGKRQKENWPMPSAGREQKTPPTGNISSFRCFPSSRQEVNP